MTLSPEQQTVVDTLVVPVKALMDTSQIKKGVDTFMEVVPDLMKTLDAVANAHPFIKGANLSSLLRLDA